MTKKNENSAASATKNDTSRRGKTTEFKKCELGNEYKTVRASQKASSSERLLNPSSTSTELVSTLAFDEEDKRIMHCVKVHDTRDRLNKTMSFDPATKLCVVCIPPAHQTFRAGNDGPGGAGRI